MGRSILVVDDEASIRFLVARGLVAEGYEVVEAVDGQDALDKLDTKPDLIVLDVIMPNVGGWDVLAEIRRRGEMPVIMLTAENDEHARIHGLDLGADDYLAKPFSVGELVARVRSVLRRSHRGDDIGSVIQADGLQIEISTRRVLVDGEQADLTRREFELLSFLATHPNRALTIAELLERVWGSSVDYQDKHTVAEHVRRLRQKIGDRWIETVRGVGYRFAPAGVTPPRPDDLATV